MLDFVKEQFIFQSMYHGELALRIFFAGLLGTAIGFERKNRNKLAGVRTHAIVALGAALMMVVSKYGFSDIDKFDASRVASQIVSGVGFLGAGIIFVKNNTSVSGLTTAAGIWATAGVGMSMGAGQYFISTISTVIILVMQVVFHRVRFLANEAFQEKFRIVLKKSDKDLKELEDYMAAEKIEIKSIKIAKTDVDNLKVDFELLFPAGYDKTDFINRLAEKENIISVRG
nr:MgtC/SapB family protein [uncultured Catonella sp.]